MTMPTEALLCVSRLPIQQATPSETSVAPAIRAKAKPALVSGTLPSKIEAKSAGTASTTIPVAISMIALTDKSIFVIVPPLRISGNRAVIYGLPGN